MTAARKTVRAVVDEALPRRRAVFCGFCGKRRVPGIVVRGEVVAAPTTGAPCICEATQR